ncbi:MAG TPA: YjgP/YjgQ family permease, partial [Candidatus Acetothermia bacterium]|nr:YjgP/YjgQ family permease [Candidatus Acetothermia bacterium]
MIMKRSDRYILSEMIGPFLISVGGLLLFILLNLILSLSDLMVDRGVGIGALVHLLLLKLPSLLVLALPVSGLFATFLGLGRLVHDREVIAFQAAGISLRRLLLPLVIAATLIAAADFALYNWAVPSSEHLYQQTLRGIIFRGGVPHVRANTFFKGQEGEFFYVRSYDEKTGTLSEVLVYDVTGKLFPQAKSAVTILTAKTGRWQGDAWTLDEGKVYGYDHDGTLIYSGSFSSLEIATGEIGADFLFGSRSPSEMRIGELRQQIALLRRSGTAVDDLIVECNLKVAMPMATIVFVLFGGATSLIFGWRSRAVGIVIGFVLVGFFQGALLWTQTLGRRGIISPPLGAWLPDIIFGAIGVLLFLRLDRLHRTSMWGHLRRILPFFLILIAIGLPSLGQEVQPLTSVPSDPV